MPNKQCLPNWQKVCQIGRLFQFVYVFWRILCHERQNYFLRALPEFLHFGVFGIFFAQIYYLSATIEGTRLSLHIIVQQKVYGRIGTLQGSANDGAEEQVGQWVKEHLHAYDASIHYTRVNSIHRYAKFFYSASQFHGKQRNCQFAIAIRPDSYEATLTSAFKEVRKVQTSHRIHHRCHVHNARTLLHYGDEQSGQKVRTNIIHAYRAFQSIYGKVLSRFQRTGIVHEQVYLAKALLDSVGKVAHRLQIGQIYANYLYILVASLFL